MTILVCGSEGDWALFENTLNTLGADDKRRGSVQLDAGDQMFKAFTGSDDIWVHARIASEVNDNSIGLPQTILSIRDSGGVELLTLTDTGALNSSTNFISLRYILNTTSGLTSHSETYPYTAQQWHNYDMRFIRSTTTSTNDTLEIFFYRDEVLRFNVTVTDSGGFGQASQILLQARNEDTDDDQTYFQDIVVSDGVPTVGMELATLVPSAVGNYSGFTNDYTNIDDNGYDQSTVISADALGVRESWIFGTPSFNLGDKIIYAVVINTVAQTDITNTINDFQPFLRIGGTDYNSASTLGSNNIAPDSYVTVFTTNPSTSQPWEQSELSGLEAGLLTV